MPLEHHATMGMLSPRSASIFIALVLVSFIYVWGWRRVLGASASAIQAWRAASFLIGIFLVWVALGSPLVAYDHDLLTVHMIQHLLLMTFAPALILLGEPLLAFRHGLPRFGKGVLDPLLQRPLVQGFGRAVSRPSLCWTASALTLLGWHAPALFTLGMHSELWHSIEQATFLGAGFLFWWPVIQPWPSVSTGPQWWTLLYLFLATFPCDILSGFLVFSDRVAYPVYFSMPRHFGFSVLQDQQCAAALMWTCVTLAYLIPAAILSTRLLSPPSFSRGDLVQTELCGGAASQRDSQRMEAI
jgi:cytochrome c oxidase assembly factor CtaG